MPETSVAAEHRGLERRAPAGAGLAATAVGVASFFYRFNALGGSLGGFGNDHFIHLSRARLMVAGEWPFRDFSDPGAPLTSGLSALVQWLFGYNLFGEALLTVGAISAGAALTVWLASQVTGRVWPGFLVGLLQVGLSPRLYNYPKILLFAVAIWLAWRYADRPRPERLFALASVAAIGFLFRHDYVIYIGALAATTVLVTHRASLAMGVRAIVTLAVLVPVLLTPFFLFLQVSGGLRPYFREAAEFARADSQRTSFRFPTLDLRLSAPAVVLAREKAAPPPHINVRWVPALPAETRTSLERSHGLMNGELREGTTWSYDIVDTSRGNIEAIVRSPNVLDTHGINRSTYALNVPPVDQGWRATIDRLRFAPEVVSGSNAVAWLYYALVALPALAAIIWLWRFSSKAFARHEVVESAAYVWPVIVLMALFAVGFLSRGTTEARLADVGVPAGILTAWVMCPGRERRAYRALPSRWLVRGVVTVLFLGSAWAVGIAGAVHSTADRSGFMNGASSIGERARRIAARLGTTPPIRALEHDANTPVAQLAAWVHRCSKPDDRLLVIGNMPELYFFSGRLPAGGHVWFVPGYGTGKAAQEKTLSRVRPYSVPVVIADGELYDESYRAEFPLIDAYISEHYRAIGARPLGDHAEARVLLLRTARWAYTDGPTGLPCGVSAATE